MKQQLTLAIAYATGARYLLLDEPMNALDPSRVDLHSEILRKLADSGYVHHHVIHHLGFGR